METIRERRTPPQDPRVWVAKSWVVSLVEAREGRVGETHYRDGAATAHHVHGQADVERRVEEDEARDDERHGPVDDVREVALRILHVAEHKANLNPVTKTVQSPKQQTNGRRKGGREEAIPSPTRHSKTAPRKAQPRTPQPKSTRPQAPGPPAAQTIPPPRPGRPAPVPMTKYESPTNTMSPTADSFTHEELIREARARRRAPPVDKRQQRDAPQRHGP